MRHTGGRQHVGMRTSISARQAAACENSTAITHRQRSHHQQRSASSYKVVVKKQQQQPNGSRPQQRQTTRRSGVGSRVRCKARQAVKHLGLQRGGTSRAKQIQQPQSKTPLAIQSASQGPAIFRRRGRVAHAPPPP